MKHSKPKVKVLNDFYNLNRYPTDNQPTPNGTIRTYILTFAVMAVGYFFVNYII